MRPPSRRPITRGRVGRRRGTGIGEREPGGDGVAQRGIHRERAAGERVAVGQAGDAAGHVDVEVAEAVSPVLGSGGADGVGDQGDPAGALRQVGEAHGRRVQVVAVDDQLARHGGTPQAGAERSRLAVVHRRHGVAEVGRDGRAGLDGGDRVGPRAVGVPDRHRHAGGHELAHGVERPGTLGGDRHHPQMTAAGGDQGRHGVGRGVDHVLGVLGAAPAGGEERALEVDARGTGRRRSSGGSSNSAASATRTPRRARRPGR